MLAKDGAEENAAMALPRLQRWKSAAGRQDVSGPDRLNNRTQGRLLIVEDEGIVAADLELSLSRMGHEVVGIAETGQQAIEMTEKFLPDLVLMDIGLQLAQDGTTAANTIRERWQIPVIFVTANSDDETIRRARAAGPYAFLTKPIRTDELKATIEVTLHQHQLGRELFAQHAWLTTVLGSLSDGVIATDTAGTVRYLNPVAEALIGWTPVEAFGKAIEEVYPLRTFAGERVWPCQLRKALATGKPSEKECFLARTKTGTEVPLEDSAAPIWDGDRLVGAVTIFRDITERLQKERQQTVEREQLEEQMHATADTLGQTRAELRRLAASLMTAQEEERRRIARGPP